MGPESYPSSDLALSLREHVLGGLSSELSLDLALNELVVRTANSTRASAAAVALMRGSAMVCRAATGENVPELGTPLSLQDGLSGACLRSRRPQLCSDSSSDLRVDPDVTLRLGIRSILVVPVFDGQEVIGVLEAFSPTPNAFNEHDRALLETFAADSARLRAAALYLEHYPPQPPAPVEDEPIISDTPAATAEALPDALPDLPALAAKPWMVYDPWSVALGILVLAAAVGLSFLSGLRMGSLPAPLQRVLAESDKPAVTAGAPVPLVTPGKPAQAAARPVPRPSNEGDLVVYDRGKVVFREKPSTGVPPAGETLASLRAASEHRWLAPEEAAARLRQRVEPQYPPDAIAAHRSGDVILDVVVGNDGSVASVRPLSGDPMLAAAAADAVRNWRYEPYQHEGTASTFETDVTLTFALPN
jgi:TonB family protein